MSLLRTLKTELLLQVALERKGPPSRDRERTPKSTLEEMEENVKQKRRNKTLYVTPSIDICTKHVAFMGRCEWRQQVVQRSSSLMPGHRRENIKETSGDGLVAPQGTCWISRGEFHFFCEGS